MAALVSVGLGVRGVLAGVLLLTSLLACSETTGPALAPLAPELPRPRLAVTVRDAGTQAPVTGAQVVTSAGGTRVGAVTDASGHALLPALPPGRYTVVVRRIGYTATTVTLRIPAARDVPRDTAAAAATGAAARVVPLQITLASAPTCTLGWSAPRR